MSESTTESNNPKPLSDRIFLIIMTKYDVLSNKVNPVWKRITKLDSDYQIVTRIRFATAVLFFLGYLYTILHRLSEHNFEYLKACTKEGNVRYIDLFIIEPCLCYDVACGLFFLFFLIDVGQKLIKRYKITNNQFVFLLVLELSYGIVRGQSWNDYTLTHFERWTSLYYADIIWLFGLYLIFFKCLMTGIQTLIKCLSDTIVAKKEKLTYKSPISNATPENILTENNNQGFQQPVKTDTSPSINKGIKGLLYDKKSKDDTLHRKPFAEQLANRILATNNPEGSVAVAVTGEWASGKSTFLSYIKEYLEGKAIVIEMNPGATESKRLLVKDFFDTIAEELQSYDAAVSELVYDYVDSLLEVHENGIIKVLKKVFAFNKTNSTKERFKTLSGCIKQLHQPLIIFIDDLDRLDKKETKEVLRLIRNTANFSNVVYIVAFDKKYVIDQIRTEEDKEGKYLDKLFQLEVSLPFYESNKITDYLFKVLEERYPLQRYHIGILKTHVHVGGYVKSHRDVHRLVNSFSVIYDCYKSERTRTTTCDFGDLFLLEIIRLYSFKEYQKLFELGGIDEYEKKYRERDELFLLPIIEFWKLGDTSYLTSNRIKQKACFGDYFLFKTDDITPDKEFSTIIDQASLEDCLSKIKKYDDDELKRFVNVIARNLTLHPLQDGEVLTVKRIDRTLEILIELHRENLEKINEYHYYQNDVESPMEPINLAIREYLCRIFIFIFTNQKYIELFRLDTESQLVIIGRLDAWMELEYDIDVFIKLFKNLNKLDRKNNSWNGIENVRSKYSKVLFLNMVSDEHSDLKECWNKILNLIRLSIGELNFKEDLENLIFKDKNNSYFFVKRLYKEKEIDYKLQIEFINKVWGDKASFKQAIKDKEGNCTADIKPILQQLSTLLNESRPITEEVLKEEKYQELRLLEKEDEY